MYESEMTKELETRKKQHEWSNSEARAVALVDQYGGGSAICLTASSGIKLSRRLDALESRLESTPKQESDGRFVPIPPAIKKDIAAMEAAQPFSPTEKLAGMVEGLLIGNNQQSGVGIGVALAAALIRRELPALEQQIRREAKIDMLAWVQDVIRGSVSCNQVGDSVDRELARMQMPQQTQTTPVASSSTHQQTGLMRGQERFSTT